ncbi:MAG: type II secretion system protein [Patescibacteria group bacterium]
MKKQSGVTLIELIVIITLLGVLVLIGITYFRAQALKGNDARRKADIRRIQVAVEEYEKDYDCYPLSSLVSCNPGTELRPYISKIPCDPVTNAAYFYEHADSLCPSWYRLYMVLENKKDISALNNIGPYGAFNYVAGSPNAPAFAATEPSPPLPSGGGAGEGEISGYYGCRSDACVPIAWDPSRPGPECDPNYQSPTCYSQCGPVATECTPWN